MLISITLNRQYFILDTDNERNRGLKCKIFYSTNIPERN